MLSMSSCTQMKPLRLCTRVPGKHPPVSCGKLVHLGACRAVAGLASRLPDPAAGVNTSLSLTSLDQISQVGRSRSPSPDI